MPNKHQALSFLLAISGCLAADRTDSELKSLFAAHDWFKLRDTVERSADAPEFYKGAVACAFNSLDHAERHFRAVFETPGDAHQAAEAHGLQATIASLPAKVVFSGLTPSFLGLYQVNVQVPGGTAPGLQPLSITVNGQRSNEVRVQIR